MILRSKYTISQVENGLAARDASPALDLVLPQTFRAGGPGKTAALIQFVLTWAQRNPAGRLVTPISTDEQLIHFARTPIGLIAGLASGDLIGASGRALTARFRREALAHLEELARSEVRRGDQILLLCADHLPVETLAPALYHPGSLERKLRGRVEFRSLLMAASSTVLKHVGQPHSDPRLAADLGVITRELFENTHDWARRDVSGNENVPSFRGVLVLAHRFLSSPTDEDDPFAAYLRNFRSPNRQRQAFLEVSVFDTGPGMAARWLGRPISAESDRPVTPEIVAVVDCFQKWATSSQRTHRGIGLDEVMSTLTQARGFLRLRTGRVLLSRDCIRAPWTRVQAERPKQNLMSWAVGDDPRPSPFALGTLATIVVPIGGRSQQQLSLV